MTSSRGSEREPLDKVTAAEIGLAACRNSLALAEEATLLSENGHEARTFVLSALAGEELAKGWVAVLAQRYGDELEFWDSFWGVLEGSDIEKMRFTLFLEKTLPKLAGLERDEMARVFDDVFSEDLQSQKLRGTYVDYEDGQVRRPDEIASNEEAKDLARRLRKSIVAWAIILQMTLEKARG